MQKETEWPLETLKDQEGPRKTQLVKADWSSSFCSLKLFKLVISFGFNSLNSWPNQTEDLGDQKKDLNDSQVAMPQIEKQTGWAKSTPFFLLFHNFAARRA